MESMTITSQSPGCDWSTMARPAPVPSNSLTLTLTPFSVSNGSSSAGSAWSHHTSALSSCAWAGASETTVRIAAEATAQRRWLGFGKTLKRGMAPLLRLAVVEKR
jgi:hypothetical protein